MTQQAFFEHVVRALEAEGIPYMVTGSVAAMVYGEPRLTNDMDIVLVLAPRHIQPLLDAFASDEYYAPPREVILDEIRHRGQFNVINVASGSKVDFILCKYTEFAKEEFSRRQRVQLTANTESESATPEDVILSKLAYYRLSGSRKHLEDIAGILRVSAPGLDFDHIESWARRLGLLAEWTAAKGSGAVRDD